MHDNLIHHHSINSNSDYPILSHLTVTDFQFFSVFLSFMRAFIPFSLIWATVSAFPCCPVLYNSLVRYYAMQSADPFIHIL